MQARAVEHPVTQLIKVLEIDQVIWVDDYFAPSRAGLLDHSARLAMQAWDILSPSGNFPPRTAPFDTVDYTVVEEVGDETQHSLLKKSLEVAFKEKDIPYIVEA